MKNKLTTFILLLLVITLNSQTVGTLAGSGLAGSVDSTGNLASFNLLTGICIDPTGNLFVADRYNHKIRKVTPLGKVTTVAGTGFTGSNDGPGATATFNQPTGICIDASGNLYVADTYNNKIRKITPTGVVSTFAGTGASGSMDGPGNIATFNLLGGICINSTGDLYVTDWANHKIRKVTSSGVVSTLAGSGAAGNTDANGVSASFNLPTGICADAGDNLFVVDYNNHKIRKITPSGVVTSFAGTGLIGSTDGTGASASFNYPYGICYDNSGVFFVIDTYNNKIRKITSTGSVTTIAGTGFTGSLDGNALSATFNLPTGICTNNTGSLFMADYANHKVRFMNGAVGIEELKKTIPEIKVFPNPNSGSFNVEIGSALKVLEIEVLDCTGRIVSKSAYENPENLVRLAVDLSNGIYYIQVRDSHSHIFRSRFSVTR